MQSLWRSCYERLLDSEKVKKTKQNCKQRSQVVPVGNVEKVKLESEDLSVFSGVHRKERICLLNPNTGEEHVLSFETGAVYQVE